MVEMQTFKPCTKYWLKLVVVIAVIALGILASGLVLGALLALDREIGVEGFLITLLVTVVSDLLWCIPALILTGPYYRSLSYEIHDDEIVMRVGVWTRSVKHVPFRTITNVTVKQSVLDRLLSIGSVDIQTAGISGTNTAEQSLVGLENVQQVYDLIAAQLRRFQGAMSPTMSQEEQLTVSAHSSSAADELWYQILDEVRAIRKALEK
ncbi:MAG: PH domain-containing protein [Anaerolineae bacterium]|nr:PH domain-containing protein [Anaerolineae bacterium]